MLSVPRGGAVFYRNDRSADFSLALLTFFSQTRPVPQVGVFNADEDEPRPGHSPGGGEIHRTPGAAAAAPGGKVPPTTEPAAAPTELSSTLHQTRSVYARDVAFTRRPVPRLANFAPE